MRRFAMLLPVVALALAACNSLSGDGAQSVGPTKASVSGMATVAADRANTFEALVNTRQPGECNDDTTTRDGRKGDCWLPAYEHPGYSERVLNLDDANPDSTCRTVKASGNASSQAGCWPQPGTKVRVICDQTFGKEEWRAFVLPRQRMLAEGAADTVYTQEGDVLAWNLSKFLKLSKGVADAKVPACSF